MEPRRRFAGCLHRRGEPAAGELGLAGLPCDEKSTFARGPAAGPAAMRAAYDGDCYNATTELGVDLREAVADLGDWTPRERWEDTCADWKRRAEPLFARGALPFFVGGDHAVTIPIGEALAAVGRPVTVVQFDAHPDLYEDYEGDRHAHACTAARLLEMEHVARVVQVGVRCFNAAQREVAARHGDRLEVIEARQVRRGLSALHRIDGPVYLSFDLDAFDPAFAPGVSHPVPGGLEPRGVFDFLHDTDWEWVGVDVVELNPTRDEGSRTAVLAGRLLHEAMGLALSGRR